MEGYWKGLAREDEDEACEAQEWLTRTPQAERLTIPFLRNHVKPDPPPDAERLRKLIADLADDRFTVRQTAQQELEKLGELAVPSLKKVLTGQPALETRKRVEELLDTLTASSLSGDQVRLVRAVEVLDRLNTAEARQILETLAKGAPGALPTREAQAVLDRLAKRPASRP